MKKKGFTLIELIEALALLAVILVITTPLISDFLEGARINAFKTNVKSIIQTIDLRKKDLPALNPAIVTENNISDLLNKPNADYYNIEVTVDEDDIIHIVVEGKNKLEGLTACGTNQNVIVGSLEDCGLSNSTY